MSQDFPVVTASDGQPRFMVWSRAQERFETYNGNQSWRSWELLRADLLADQGREAGERLWQQYEAQAPDAVKLLGKPAAHGVPRRRVRPWMLKLGMAVLVLLLAVEAWPGYIRPVFEELGLVQYQRPLSYYDRFLEQATADGCVEKSAQEEGAMERPPGLRLFFCRNGDIRYWQEAMPAPAPSTSTEPAP